MNKMTAKAEPAMFIVHSERLRDYLQTASTQLRRGEDAEGIEDLFSALLELEKIVEGDQNSLQPQIELKQLLIVLKTLDSYITNQDITGISDLMEDALYPMACEWMKGNNGT